MAAKAETLAREFETKAAAATAEIERLDDAEWKRVTAAERWPVGVVAHHIAVGHEVIVGMAKAIADGTPGSAVAMADLDAMNARHAAEHAHCTKAETVALLTKNAAAAAATVRAIADADFDRKAPVLTGMPPMSVEALVGLLGQHIDEHLGSIRATAGRPAAAA